MNFLCALNNTVNFFRSCKEPWILVVISLFISIILSFFLPYQTRIFIAEIATGGYNPTARILTSFLATPFLLIHAYLLCILTTLALDYGRGKKISLKSSAKIGLRRYPHFILSAIVFCSILFLPFYMLGHALSSISSFSLNLASKVLVSTILIMAFSVYISIRFSLFYCFVIDGVNWLKSLKSSWIATKELWKDIFLIGLSFVILSYILSIPVVEIISSLIYLIGLPTALTFLYLQIKKEVCYET